MSTERTEWPRFLSNKAEIIFRRGILTKKHGRFFQARAYGPDLSFPGHSCRPPLILDPEGPSKNDKLPAYARLAWSWLFGVNDIEAAVLV